MSFYVLVLVVVVVGAGGGDGVVGVILKKNAKFYPILVIIVGPVDKDALR